MGFVSSSGSTSCSTVAGLSYIEPGGEKPFSYAFEPPPGVPVESGGFDLALMNIRDARGTRPSVHVEGFELWSAPSLVASFLDEEQVKKNCYLQASQLALAATGASRAFVFDHLLRKRDQDQAALNFGRRHANGVAGANGRIHNDYTEGSGARRLGLVLKDPSLVAQVQRFSIINIWRPIRHPVLDTPLALCDSRTIGVGDFVTSEVRYPGRTGEIYLLSHSARHQWWYFPAMTRDEALVFKQFDSQISGVARFTPHCAFDHPAKPVDYPPRESIEFRCLVVYD